MLNWKLTHISAWVIEFHWLRLERTISIVLFIGPINFSQVASSEPKKGYNPQGAFLMKKVLKFIVYRTPYLF